MKIKASVGRAPKDVDLRDYCHSLKLTADGPIQGKLLSQIYNQFNLDGGLTLFALLSAEETKQKKPRKPRQGAKVKQSKKEIKTEIKKEIKP